ncbi:hypothetical protein LEP1GSC052_2387 [Leptospira kmetyi serovar Malaysia str. Bejo-Iso9]|nr:hypothetical protein LEP1GSC052_2387 [Leptospira kmetyi serovar Malaysia str. Bejo-Iso9]
MDSKRRRIASFPPGFFGFFSGSVLLILLNEVLNEMEF